MNKSVGRLGLLLFLIGLIGIESTNGVLVRTGQAENARGHTHVRWPLAMIYRMLDKIYESDNWTAQLNALNRQTLAKSMDNNASLVEPYLAQTTDRGYGQMLSFLHQEAGLEGKKNYTYARVLFPFKAQLPGTIYQRRSFMHIHEADNLLLGKYQRNIRKLLRNETFASKVASDAFTVLHIFWANENCTNPTELNKFKKEIKISAHIILATLANNSAIYYLDIGFRIPIERILNCTNSANPSEPSVPEPTPTIPEPVPTPEDIPSNPNVTEPIPTPEDIPSNPNATEPIPTPEDIPSNPNVTEPIPTPEDIPSNPNITNPIPAPGDIPSSPNATETVPTPDNIPSSPSFTNPMPSTGAIPSAPSVPEFNPDVSRVSSSSSLANQPSEQAGIQNQFQGQFTGSNVEYTDPSLKDSVTRSAINRVP